MPVTSRDDGPPYRRDARNQDRAWCVRRPAGRGNPPELVPSSSEGAYTSQGIGSRLAMSRAKVPACEPAFSQADRVVWGLLSLLFQRNERQQYLRLPSRENRLR